jgi:DNA-3-methyladenine glycosylase II
VELSIHPTAPYNFERSLSVFARWRDANLLDAYVDRAYWRVVPTSRGSILVSFRSAGTVEEPKVVVATHSPTNWVGEAEIKRVAEHVLNARLDVAPSVALMRADPVLAGHLETFYGVRPVQTPSLFEALIIAILEQQIALSVAIRLKARTAARYGEAFVYDNRTYYAFPSPTVLEGAATDDLRALGMSHRKAEYIVGLAGLVDSGQLDLEALAHLADDELIARLTSIRGIGRWTAEYAAIRALGRMCFLLADDLGVKNMVSELYFGGRTATPNQVRSLLSGWGDQKGLLLFYLLNLKRLSAADPAKHIHVEMSADGRQGP